MKKVREQCYSLFSKDFIFLKFIFTLLASYLIIKELYTYLVLKPTYTSEAKRYIKGEDFPEVILCPQPPIDVNAAKSRGYFEIQGYFLGMGVGFTGWSGNASEEVNEVFDEISVLKSVEECPFGDYPDTYFVHRDGISIKMEPINFKLTKALYPFHICCKEDPIHFFTWY